MYICPTCSKQFSTEERITKHFLACWKAIHPEHKSTPAPHGIDIEVRKESQDMNEFFEQFKKGGAYARSSN